MMAENPAFAGAEASTAGSVDIEAALKDGTLTAEQAVVLMQEQLRAEMRAEIAAAQLGLAGGGATLASAVRGVVAKLTEAPANFHLATVFYLATDAPEDAAMVGQAPLLFAGSLAMVVLQSVAAVGVFGGTIHPSCATSDHCDAGTYCSVGREYEHCEYCSYGPAEDTHNLTLVTQACTIPYAARVNELGDAFLPTTVASWCTACVRNDGTVDPMSHDSLIAGHQHAMGLFDYAALVFASFIVAFTVVGELKDIQVTSIAVTHADEKLSKGWTFALRFVLWMRRYVFLPIVVANVPTLVLLKGGDALRICLNAVAILFLCEIDNIAFDFALGERVRTRVEAAGRVNLADDEAAALARTKVVHVVLIVLSLVVAVWSGNIFVGVFAVLLGALGESFVPGASVVETAKRASKVVAAFILGFGTVFALMRAAGI